MSDELLSKQLAGLSKLVQIEWDVRQADSAEAIGFIAVNDTHRIIAYDHAIFWHAKRNKIEAISGGLKVEPTAPQIVWFNALAKHIARQSEALDTLAILPANLPATLARDFAKWVAGEILWVPLSGPKSQLLGGLFLLRNTTFNEGEQRILARLGNAFGTALTALRARVLRSRPAISKKAIASALAVVGIALLTFVKLPMTILAEARVSPSQPMLVTAPIDGVIAKILVRPNENVRAGQPLLQFDTTSLLAEKEIAAKRVAVLRAQSHRAEAQAFTDVEARAQISSQRAKLVEGEALLSYARQRLARTNLKAPVAGVAIIDDTTEWIGHPVKIGERIMLIASPEQAELEIRIAVEDALYAVPGAKVDFFLATAPADPIAASIKKVSYNARPQPDQSTKFIAEAEFTGKGNLPRLGLTGTARIEGPRVSLGYMLLRKPLAKLRRLLGI